MRWRGRRASTNVDDWRGRRIPGGKAGGIGCGGIVLILLFILLGGDPQQLIEVMDETPPAGSPSGSGAAGSGAGGSGAGGLGAPSDELGEFAAVVLGETESVWGDLFAQMGRRYQEPTLVLFSDAVRSACGFNSAAVGPFYCPADRQIYIDLTFFDTLTRRFGAPGDFAQAYVIAHEVGHHVQNLLGISAEVSRAQRAAASRREANALSVRLELQADCLAGVWAHHVPREILEPGDIEEGLNAAAAIGDDAIQRRSAGRIRPESWTHGSSEDRVRWLRRGLQSGDPGSCDTF